MHKVARCKLHVHLCLYLIVVYVTWETQCVSNNVMGSLKFSYMRSLFRLAFHVNVVQDEFEQFALGDSSPASHLLEKSLMLNGVAATCS